MTCSRPRDTRWWPFAGRFLVLIGVALGGMVALGLVFFFVPEGRATDFVMSLPLRMLMAFMLVCITNLYLLSTERDVVEKF